MTFYSANHSGINDLNIFEIQGVIPDRHRPSGYLSKAEIGLALTNKDCVGVRVYKIRSGSPSSSINGLIVCGVLENGFDAPEKNIGFLTDKEDTIFRMVKKISITQGEHTFTPEAAGVFKRSQIEAILSEEPPLIAYFSLAMLNRLLGGAQVTGILLYEVDLTPIQARVPNLSVPAPHKLASYLAFAARGTGSGEVSLPSFDLVSTPFVLSDLPCPGHCLQIDPKGVVSTGDLVAIQSRFDETPYPRPWDNA
jgi:hypothetical protein